MHLYMFELLDHILGRPFLGMQWRLGCVPSLGAEKQQELVSMSSSWVHPRIPFLFATPRVVTGYCSIMSFLPKCSGLLNIFPLFTFLLSFLYPPFLFPPHHSFLIFSSCLLTSTLQIHSYCSSYTVFHYWWMQIIHLKDTAIIFSNALDKVLESRGSSNLNVFIPLFYTSTILRALKNKMSNFVALHHTSTTPSPTPSPCRDRTQVSLLLTTPTPLLTYPLVVSQARKNINT